MEYPQFHMGKRMPPLKKCHVCRTVVKRLEPIPATKPGAPFVGRCGK
jgi:hypothetical protein